MECDNCGFKNDTVEETEFGKLCDTCYLILLVEHTNMILDEGD